MASPADANRLVLLPALAMCLGWGLRGYIGGGPLGAMIPGAMTALLLCLLLRIEDAAAARIAAFGAIAVGFGGEMTYGQTVGFVSQPETFLWGWLGLGVKGAVWGLLGGAVLASAFVLPDRRRHLIALALLPAGAYLGWKLINEPKLIYFSNRLDKPRPEIWAGLLFAAVLFLFTLRSPLANRFALWGTVGGGIGFSTGGALIGWGRSTSFDPHWFPWWKGMEFTFGFLLGLGFAWAARNSNAAAASPGLADATRRRWFWLAVPAALLFFHSLEWLEETHHIRFSFVIFGALLLAVALYSRSAAWHIGVTFPIAAALVDLMDAYGRSSLTWTLVILASTAIAWLAASRPDGRSGFLLLTLASVAISWAKSFSAPWPWRGHLLVELAFTAMAVALYCAVAGKPDRSRGDSRNDRLTPASA